MMFKEEFDSVPHIQASGNILNMAKGFICESPTRAMTDSIGTFAYVYRDFIMVAKQYIFGDVVSCHYKVVEEAQKNHIGILMFISDIERFYLFDAIEVIREGKINFKGDAKMINFSIRLGKRWEVLKKIDSKNSLVRWTK